VEKEKSDRISLGASPVKKKKVRRLTGGGKRGRVKLGEETYTRVAKDLENVVGESQGMFEKEKTAEIENHKNEAQFAWVLVGFKRRENTQPGGAPTGVRGRNQIQRSKRGHQR